MDERRILIVDDDASQIVPVLHAMDSRAEVDYRIAYSLTEGLEQIHSGTRWTAALFDLLLPVGTLPRDLVSAVEFEASVQKLGGVLLASVFQHRFPGCPMGVWSLAPRPDGLSPFIDSGVCRFFSKSCLPDEIEELSQFLGQDPKPTSLLTDLWDSVQLAPNLGGLGVDLKKLMRDLRRYYGP